MILVNYNIYYVIGYAVVVLVYYKCYRIPIDLLGDNKNPISM